MPNVLNLVLALLAAGSLPASSQDLHRGPGKIRCAAVDGQMKGLVDYLRMLASTTKPEAVRARESIKVPVIDTMLIKPVQTDSLCRRAGVLLNRAFHLPDSTSRTVYLVRMGSRYWIEEKEDDLRSHYIAGLVVDSTLTTVLAYPGR